MNMLSKISYWVNYVSSCGRNRTKTSDIRKMITCSDSIRVTLVLILPQIILQIINVSLQSTRMYSVEVTNGVYICESDSGIALLIFGIVLAVVPFILSLLLNIESLGMPDKFREYDEVWNSMISSVCILIITLP